MKNIILKKWTTEYKPTQNEYVFRVSMSETYEGIVSSVSFWFKCSQSFIEMTARVFTTDKQYPYEEVYIVSYDEAREYFNNPELFLANNCERRDEASPNTETTTTNDTTDVDTNTPILTKEKAIEEMIGMGVNVVFR